MEIKIAERLRPFRHNPGTACMLPGTSLAVHVFPAKLVFQEMSRTTPKLVSEIDVNVQGPVKDFTVQLDLERGHILVWGRSKTGYFRYIIASKQKGISIAVEKDPGLEFKAQGALEVDFQANEEGFVSPRADRLSLGVSKAQDWELVKRRADLAEIFPFWLRLGQLIPPPVTSKASGTAALLKKCEEVIREGTPNDYLAPFHELFLAGFEGILVPTLRDNLFQGIVHEEPVTDDSPLVILSQGAQLIRSLFVQSQGSELHVLPALPKEFHSGRFLGVRVAGIGELDLEWSKKQIRRMILRSETHKSVLIHFRKGIERYRLQKESEARGSWVDAGVPLVLEAGKVYRFDRFM